MKKEKDQSFSPSPQSPLVLTTNLHKYFHLRQGSEEKRLRNKKKRNEKLYLLVSTTEFGLWVTQVCSGVTESNAPTLYETTLSPLKVN